MPAVPPRPRRSDTTRRLGPPPWGVRLCDGGGWPANPGRHHLVSGLGWAGPSLAHRWSISDGHAGKQSRLNLASLILFAFPGSQDPSIRTEYFSTSKEEPTVVVRQERARYEYPPRNPGTGRPDSASNLVAWIFGSPRNVYPMSQAPRYSIPGLNNQCPTW